MATLLRRRDEHDQLNNVSADEVGANVSDTIQLPVISPDSTLEEPGSKIWGPYLELADKYDKDLVHNWRDDMDSLLIFAALFSASVTAFVIESYKTLVQDSGDVTVDVLLQISRQLANMTEVPITMRPPFQPDSTDIAINIFWFLSLAFSLACALAAVLVRQWARQYLRFPRGFSSTTEQARARQFLFENMQWWKMELVVEMIPALLHISLILFFIGLLLFAHTISVTLAIYLLCFSTISGTAYTFITVTLLIFPGCPYKTPVSSFFGILVRFAMGLFWTMWTCLIVLLACLIVWFLSILSSLMGCCLSSNIIPEWKLAVEISKPLRSHLFRHLTTVRSVDPSSQVNIHRFGPRYLRNLWTSIRRLRTSVTSSFLLVAQSVSKSIVHRRQVFQNDISLQDAHALRWAMEFSKKDAELFTIIRSVPEFVQIHDSNVDIRLVMWNSGVMAQAQRLLHSSAIRSSRVTNQSILMACLETIIWSTRCATHVLDEDSAWIDVGTLFTDDPTLEMDEVEWATSPSSGKDKQTFECARLNLLLRWVYLLEKWVLTLDEEGFRREYHTHLLKGVTILLRYSKSLHRDLTSRTYHDLLDFRNRFSRMTTSRMEFCKVLGGFRAAWVSQFLNISFCNIQLTSSFDATIWNNLCDFTTHLPPFPISTLESQEGMFMLVNASCRAIHTGQPLPVENLMNSKRAESMLTAYSQVLFGEADKQLLLSKSLHIQLHRKFISRVHVYSTEGLPFHNSSETVEIPFDAYCEILDDFMSEYQPAYEDLIAGAIQKIIRSRLRDANECSNVAIIVGARHLSVARFLLTDRRAPLVLLGLATVVQQTAEEFGYAFQSATSRQIEMHAELQYYEPGLYGRDDALFY